MATPRAPAQPDAEEIPQLMSVVPSIFVPLTESILEPREPPKNRIERLERIIQSLDIHEKGVKDNLMWLFQREEQRVRNAAKRAEEQFPPQEEGPCVEPEEADAIIANMSAPSVAGFNYNIVDLPAPMHNSGAPGLTLREDTVTHLMSILEGAMTQVQGYEAHMQSARNYYLERLSKEIERDRLFGAGPAPGP